MANNHQIMNTGGQNNNQYQDMTRKMGGDGEGYNFDPIVINKGGNTFEQKKQSFVTPNQNPTYLTSQ